MEKNDYPKEKNVREQDGSELKNAQLLKRMQRIEVSSSPLARSPILPKKVSNIRFSYLVMTIFTKIVWQIFEIYQKFH